MTPDKRILNLMTQLTQAVASAGVPASPGLLRVLPAAQHPKREPQVSPAVARILALPLESFSKAEVPTGSKPVTYASLVLDESGSMLPHASTALEGLNTQVGVIQEGAKDAGDTYVSLVKFSYSVTPLLQMRPVADLQGLTANEYRPSGGTALFDAIGKAVEALLERSDIEEPNTAVLVAIFTDGEENMSYHYDAATLKALISRLEATGRWTFTLMGPRGTALELAELLNLAKGNVAAFDPNSHESTKCAFAAMANASQSYMGLRGQGVTASASLYDTSLDRT